MMTAETMTLCASHAPGYARDREEQFGPEFRQGLRDATDAVRDFAPTLVVYFGGDHRLSFTDIVPGISVVLQAEGSGDRLSPTGPYRIPRELALKLSSFLIGEKFDVTVTRHIELDHGFGQTWGVVLGALDSVPVVPVFINCAMAPLAAPGRAAELGEAIGRFFSGTGLRGTGLRGTDERILFLASGGLSHSPPVLAVVSEPVSLAEAEALSAAHREAAKDLIRPEWDRRFLAGLGREDPSWARLVTQADLDPAGVGANEVRTWLAAYAAGGKPLRTVAYEPVREWVTGVGVAMSGYSRLAAVAR